MDDSVAPGKPESAASWSRTKQCLGSVLVGCRKCAPCMELQRTIFLTGRGVGASILHTPQCGANARSPRQVRHF